MTRITKIKTPNNADHVVWHIAGNPYVCNIVREPCVFCGERTVVALPPPELAKQPDGTTHVCHPALGGCNHGFVQS